MISNKLTKKLNRDKYLLLLLLPVIAHYVIFSYFPMYGLTLAFKNFKISSGILGSPWVGFKYFQDFFESIFFWRLIRNTLMLNIYSLLVGFPIPILFAVSLNEIKYGRFKKIVQTTSYFPYFISTVIVVALLFNLFNADDGAVIKLIEMFTDKKINMLGNAKLFRSFYVLTGVWQSFGWNSIIYISAMAAINPEIYEAAMIDGITRLKRVRYITIPYIMPTIILLFILAIGSMLSSDTEKLVLMLVPSVYETGDTLASYIYRTGIENANYSLSTAAGMFNSVINFSLLFFANRISRSVNGTSLW